MLQLIGRRGRGACLIATCIASTIALGAPQTLPAHRALGKRVAPIYLAVGDVRVLGRQPNGQAGGYVGAVAVALAAQSPVRTITLACSGADSATLINQPCQQGASLLNSAVRLLRADHTQIRLVTVGVGLTDLLDLYSPETCAEYHPLVRRAAFTAYRSHMTTILRALRDAAGSGAPIIALNVDAPQANACPNTIALAQGLNAALAHAALNAGVSVADSWQALGGSMVPNSALCTATWVCSAYQTFALTDRGARAVAAAVVAAMSGRPPSRSTSIPLRVQESGTPLWGTLFHAGATVTFPLSATRTLPATAAICPLAAVRSLAVRLADRHGKLVVERRAQTGSGKSNCVWLTIAAHAGQQYRLGVGAIAVHYPTRLTVTWSVGLAPQTWHTQEPITLTSSATVLAMPLALATPSRLTEHLCALGGAALAVIRAGDYQPLVQQRVVGCATISYLTPKRELYYLNAEMITPGVRVTMSFTARAA